MDNKYFSQRPELKPIIYVYEIPDAENRKGVCLGGDTARINPDLVKNRKDSSGNPWVGVKIKKLR